MSANFVAAGHLDRTVPLTSYCTGLLLPGERKSVEPMAARLCPDKVRQTHQSLHHVVAHPPWRDEDILEAVRQVRAARHAEARTDRSLDNR
jgi:SRSO17 transposase